METPFVESNAATASTQLVLEISSTWEIGFRFLLWYFIWDIIPNIFISNTTLLLHFILIYHISVQKNQSSGLSVLYYIIVINTIARNFLFSFVKSWLGKITPYLHRFILILMILVFLFCITSNGCSFHKILNVIIVKGNNTTF